MRSDFIRFNAPLLVAASFLLTACTPNSSKEKNLPSFSQGLAQQTQSDLLKCKKVDSGGVPPRITNLGKITSEDGLEWIVPANIDLENDTKASDLFNVCNDVIPNSFADVDVTNFPIHDAGGEELFTAYVFGDNYFELNVNGKLKVVDPLPFTPFNSSVIRFKAQRPVTLAIKAVDWEEYLGQGFETFGKAKYHAGDGGIVIVIKDKNDKIVAVTDNSWKAQTYYIAPLKTKECLLVNGATRNSSGCPTDDVPDGSQFYAAHWPLPIDWDAPNFNDQAWPQATTYSNEEIGVHNKPAFNHFTKLFDDNTGDASFIWSDNVVLDNIVLLRKIIN
ncbi:hypothetical protein [uncultured Psychrosphaera sp.]|uniref:hypothetical protein n=1 Tax=uncultured Psychrosphaera sp. TaxID=1403522 RepID=UPI002639A20A|nr:hypothetical protein [uncultured Psychrosphaera sp.]